MPHPVLKLPEIKVFFWHILEAKPVLIALAGQVGLPFTEVEGSMEIPDDVFVGIQLKVNSIFESADNELFLALLDVHLEH
jgi:hypothetical protein